MRGEVKEARRTPKTPRARGRSGQVHRTREYGEPSGPRDVGGGFREN